MRLLEINRTQLIRKSKQSKKGKERFDKRTRSRVANTVKAMNSIDMNKLFKEDILTVNLPVTGETDEYVVRITFGGFLAILRDHIDPSRELSFSDVSKAAIVGFNKDDVFIHCSCPDFKYRFNYFVTRNNYNSGTPETRPSNITNPNDSLGSGCKHILLVMNNTSWILRVARAIVNYVKYMEKHYPRLYADIIYPAIYGKEYEEPVQLDFDSLTSDELDTDETTLDKANEYNRERTKFQVGNDKGQKFQKNPNTPPKDVSKNQISFEEIDEE